MTQPGSDAVPEMYIRAEAARENNAIFVLRDQIVTALGGDSITRLRAFLTDVPVDKFLLLTDYCFHSSYPNDVIVYTIVKGGSELPTPSNLSALAADLKNVRDLDAAAIAFLRDARLFTFGFILEKGTRIHESREAMLESMDVSIRLQSTWVNAETHRESIKRLRELRQEAEAKGFNQLLYDRMLLAPMFAAILSTLVIEHDPLPVQAVGWFSDRDAIVEKGTSLASHFYSTILHDYCVEKNLAEPPTVGIIDHRNPNSGKGAAWFDPLIRIADYFAGPLAQIDYDSIVRGERTQGGSIKYGKVLSGVFADNANFAVIRFRGKRPPFQVSLVTFSSTPPANG